MLPSLLKEFIIFYFRFSIKRIELNNTMIINIEHRPNFQCSHETIIRKAHIKGTEREHMSYEIAAKGATNLHNNQIILNHQKQIKTIFPDKCLMTKIKYEFNHRNRLSTDHQIDIQASKKLCETLLHDKNAQKSSLKGLIQFISQDPFGFIMCSNIQVILIKWVVLLKHLILSPFNL